jgi:hypothetical protein
MNKALLILFCATVINAGRTSQWSSTFMLKEPINTILNGRNANASQNRFDISVRSSLYGRTTVLFVSGGSGEKGLSLRIYRLDGKLVADLSDLVQGSGATQVVWSAQRAGAGIFLARLQSGTRTKTVRFVFTR